MKTYNDCRGAINNYIKNPDHSNVKKNEDDVVCSHIKTQCNWIGNGVHFTCLTKASAPQNVYDKFNGGNQSKIIRED